MSHTRVGPADIGAYVLLPGSPERAAKIATYFDAPHKVAQNREHTTYAGLLDGVKVSVTSTGMGGPSSAIAMEELYRCGAHTFVRIGSCGAVSPKVRKHDVVVVNGAVRMEGTGLSYLPVEFPAVPDYTVLTQLTAAAAASGYPYTVGISIAKDAFYAQTEPESMPYAADVRARWSAYVAGGAVCTTMEDAALFLVAASRGVRCGSVLVVAANADRSDPDESDVYAPGGSESRAIEIGIDALRRLIAADLLTAARN